MFDRLCPSGVGSDSSESVEDDRRQSRNGRVETSGAKMADRGTAGQQVREEDTFLSLSRFVFCV